jgi:hypothetical protein
LKTTFFMGGVQYSFISVKTSHRRYNINTNISDMQKLFLSGIEETPQNVSDGILVHRRSQWPRSIRHELYSLARTLGSGFDTQWRRGSLCAFILCLCCPLYR